MTELARAAVSAAIDLAAEDDPKTHASTDRHGEEMLDVPAAPVETACNGERVHVVLDEHRHAEALLEQGTNRQRMPAEHRRVHHVVLAPIDDAGNAESDAEDERPVVACLGMRREDRRQPVERLRMAGLEGILEALDHLAIEVDADANEMVGGDLDAEGV